MHRRDTFVGVIAIGLALSLAIQGSASLAQKPKENSAENKGQKVEAGSRSITLPSGNVTNNPKDMKPAPASKGGSARGGYYSAMVRIDNRTPWKIQIFANGNYMGIVAPYGDSYIPSTSGNLILQGKGDFTDGTTYRWGPRAIYLDPGDTFTWSITS
jgi:hypothetical protein